VSLGIFEDQNANSFFLLALRLALRLCETGPSSAVIPPETGLVCPRTPALKGHS